ncbi:shikimate kinase [bacterium BMS3Abin01]|nr:shikimate kinase [bacterium BMS3Abin01]HDY69694.1 shikimate kinase [Actinomycetota bacterium]
MAPTVILIGFMGSGKTAVGECLAERLGWGFIDADREVERNLGMSIPEAFRSKGENFFRGVEEDVVSRILEKAAASTEGMVVSLGGGAVTSSGTRERLKREQLVMLLDEDVETAFQRAGGGGRPLAAELERFRTLYEERAGVYREAAGMIIDTRGKRIKAVAQEAEAMVREKIGEEGTAGA